MFGHGRPTRARCRSDSAARKVAAGAARVVSVLFIALAPTIVGAESIRLRIEWGGGATRLWHGRIEIDRGIFSELQPLGLDADEPGSQWTDGRSITIRQRSTRSYDALDVLVEADRDATLLIDLFDPNRNQPEDDAGAEPQRIKLSEVLAGHLNRALDQQGNRVLVRQAPGDRMRVEVDHASLVFAPDEKIALTLSPRLPELRGGSELRIHCAIVPARGAEELWSQDYEATVPLADAAPLELPLEIPAPAAEGAYRVSMSVRENGLRQRFVPVVPGRPLAERSIGFVVVSDEATPAPVASGRKADVLFVGWNEIAEIDPANPGWWKRAMQLPRLGRLPGWSPGPLSSGHSTVAEHSLGAMVRVTRPAGGEAWEAYPLEISETGAPHQLEIELPSDVSQHLGISIVEPNAAGVVTPIGLDSGVYVTADVDDDKPRLLTHRITFWPKTKLPFALITPRDATGVAMFHKLRLLQGPARLPRAWALPPQQGKRLVAAYFDRPLIPENFCATGVFDAWSGQSIDDWQTFYEGGMRLVDYVNHVGYNGLFVSVAADGSTIYPSRLLQPTPRYDTGRLGAQGLDPVRKDALELLLRLFERERLVLTPAIDFSTPLPELEAVLRQGGAEATGVEWIGADGRTWLERNGAQHGLAPYYNTLNPRVQQAMLAVVREVVERYRGHESLRGVALQLSALGFAQLPGPDWGFDDETIARFERDAKLRVPGTTGPQRFSQRAEFLMGQGRAAWLAWRAEQLADFYHRVQQELAPLGGDARLFLLGNGLFDGAGSQWQLRPALPGRVKVQDVLLQLGLGETVQAGDPRIIFLRPQRIAPPDRLAAQAIDLQVAAAREVDQQLIETASPGAFLYQPPRRLRLASFDEQSPFGDAKTYTLLVSQSSPMEANNRRRFARSLVDLDAQTIVDGGWLLPMGQETSLRRLFDVYRQLPAAKFAPVESKQPIYVRSLSQDDNTYVYVVNDSPWPTRAGLRFDASAACELDALASLGPARRLSDMNYVYNLRLDPYDLVAVRLSEGAVRTQVVAVEPEGGVRDRLNDRITELENRAAALANQPPLRVLGNGGFERQAPRGESPGWSLLENVGEVEIDRKQTYGGRQSLRLTSRQGVVSLRSELFKTPESGRLALSVWLRAEPGSPPPVLRLAIEGPHDGRTFYRFAAVGGAGPGGVPLKGDWMPYLLPVDDIPAVGCGKMRVRFDLMDAGTVWIDDVELFDLRFNKTERVEISKILASARGALETGAVSDCLRQLDGYWPQFLAANVRVVVPPVARAPRPAPRPQSPAEKEPGMTDRLRGWVPKFMQF
jgi:hypothetical protein